MTTLELYTKGAKVWIPHPEKVWEGAELEEDYKTNKKSLEVVTENNEKKTLTIKSESDLPCLRNPSILVGENDLTSLSYLHEPAVLYNLQVRFCQNRYIYTYCGIVLVAINPYDDLPIYDVDTIQTYRGQAMGDLDPHIFAVAEEAYTKLEREQRDQSIIVSGESGAGKTVSAKYAMRYFATVGGSATETQVEKKVLASSPIMEAIGNAKTTRNDNSSRFGKFIELQFNKQFHISGASMRTYLLEKSRVVFQAPDERNYHIFYQLCSARDQFPHLHLAHQDSFYYLNQGESPNVDGVDDLQTFEETLYALNLLGFKKSDLDDMFKIIASVLHLGNIKFVESIISTENEQDQEGCSILGTDSHLKILAELLEIDSKEMQQWLCTRKIVSMREVFLKPMSVEDAQAARDALAKHIYAELFNWIVLVINKALESDIPRHKFIGVLDIYGFETFETNSFEQFCINYANEKLQQQFNLHVFKLEQEEYIKEGIEWKMIDFYDNQPCIDLIETKLGILDLLDEECRMPRGTDSSWTEKLYSKCAKYSHFGKARFGTSAFTINHFADKVQYESNGFLEKNRDTVIEEQISVVKRSKNDLVRRLFGDDSQKLAVPGAKLKVISAKPAPTSQKTHKKSVGSQFRDSLNMLMTTLNATTPHYVRCIKPNDSKKPFEYNPKRAVQQLRACGVLETIRISAAGFPSRWTYVDFFYRYRVLCKFKDIKRNDMQLTCQNILNQYIKNKDMFQFGKTKIFFRAGQVAYLEKLRADKLKACCIMMQKTIRAFIWRKKYLRIKRCTINIQRYGRGYLARKLAENLRREKAAKTLQRYVRGWVKRVQYQRLKACVTGIQRYARGYLARRRYMQLRYNAKALVIQRYVRGYLARRSALAYKRKIVICQAAIRRFLARRLYKKLRIEARSIEHVKKLNKGLENKIISLQQKIDEITKQNAELMTYKAGVNELKNKLTAFKANEAEIKNLNARLIEKDKVIDKLKEDLKLERDEKIDLINEHEKYRQETQKQRDLWTQETNKLRKELDNINEIVKMNQKGAEENLKVRLEEEKMLILNEQDSDREAYQKLLQEYHCLEQHCEELEKQLNNQSQNQSSHRRNVSDLSSIDSFVINSDIAEDHGYGSVRSTTTSSSQREKLENIDWKCEGNVDSQTPSTSSSDTKHESENNKVDVGLVLKLQHKLAEVEREKLRMQKRLDELDMSPRTEKAENAARDSIKISELELVNSNLKAQLMELQNSIIEGTGSSKIHEQMQILHSELERKTEEIIQLKSVLADQTNNMKSLVNSNARLGAYINEDGELALAYETQKTINKQLELELQDEKSKYKAHEREYKLEIEKLREDNERQQRLLSANLTNTPQTQSEAFMQHEITRLTIENLDLHDKNDTLTETVRKLKKQIKLMAKKLKEAGLDMDDNFNEITDNEPNKTNVNKHTRALPSIRKKERDYLGMFSYSSGEENTIMRQLVIDLKPRTAVTLLPGLPAYIVFMCIRHTDYVNDEDKVKALLSAFTNSVKKVIKKRHEDFETMALWLSNTLRLVHNMKQYSGDRAFQAKNTPKQNEQCLRNFDLSEYRQVLSDIAVWIYQGLIRKFAEKIQPLVIPAILEHEEIPGISGNKPSGFRGRSSSVATSPEPSQKPTTAVLLELTNHHKILSFYGVDPEVISQIFKQIFYFLCATSLNNLLLRQELCHWSKGFQIRHNLSHFEMWTREKGLDEASIQSTLQPIIQAAHLLQARKTEEDVASVCEMCSALTPLQICKILNLYKPVDEFEQHVPPSFISKVKAKLQERNPTSEQQTLLMDVKYHFPVRFPFNPSVICLEDIEIPEVLKLPQLEKL
ncbi:unconventional myosin-Va [Tribolium castaneum]|uniref:Unconventional myosin-Vb-like Protein n=1 Tax=Tribolium castaneum TaxID=7070 RepID=D6WQH7_TRICA|nr:PREDICTED: unconventional myosin-Va isoform X2 [Tribolium castaneum]EFA06975.2 Unconventional myosin-Vb-like Protein [Tribolium castaneum]|eukprot:XP_008195823.1 PREDICTED: unconventional myosin-Va isoform X2 [Tribolium castaneum]